MINNNDEVDNKSGSDDSKCKHTNTGNCEDCSLPTGEDCPFTDEDDFN